MAEIGMEIGTDKNRDSTLKVLRVHWQMPFTSKMSYSAQNLLFSPKSGREVETARQKWLGLFVSEPEYKRRLCNAF